DVPLDMQHKLNDYLRKRLGNKYFRKLEFVSGKVFLNETDANPDTTKKLLLAVIKSKPTSGCDTTMNYPIYSIIYHLKIPEIGIENIELNVVIDKKGTPIKDIDFPLREFADNIIPIDKVHSLLIKRKI